MINQDTEHKKRWKENGAQEMEVSIDVDLRIISIQVSGGITEMTKSHETPLIKKRWWQQLKKKKKEITLFAATWIDLAATSKVIQKDKYHTLSDVESKMTQTNEPLQKTERDSQTRRTDCGYQREKGWRRDGLGVWDEPMQTSIYSMYKQQGPTVEHRELY